MRRRWMGRTLAIGALFAMIPGSAHGQRGPLVADRPDFTEAAATVGRGVVQLEFGYTYEYDRPEGGRGGVWTHSLGEPLLRVGALGESLELRVGLRPVSVGAEADGRNVTETGMEDLYLGVKLALAEQEGLRPAVAILPQVTVPAGSDAFTSDRTLPGVNFIYGWDLTEDVALAGSTQVNRALSDAGGGGPRGEAAEYAEWAQSAVAGFSLGARAGVYAEWFAFFHAEVDGTRAEHYANGGFTWSFSDDLQWDIRAGVGLNESATGFFTGTGLVVRFP
ncbi:MAG: transporter [Gemmatimonadales bacterium]|nr:transporter [Gemmatimonadales bacterium]MYG49972.1 transporter [Gemmatimonadales bacterium]MYK02002.1 transporter [Candidatus Palauibacter ramosifaciens]